MPINIGKDKKGRFIRWGYRTKYYYYDQPSYEIAYEKVLRQMRAIFHSGYKKK